MKKTVPTDPQSAHCTTLRVSRSLNYLLYFPESYYSESKTRWPLLVFLHGAGERGDDLTLVKKHGPPNLIARGKKFPCVVVSPQCPHDTWWDLPALEALITALTHRHRVDPQRIYLTGLSMGGYAVWNLAERAPFRYAAIAPICGGGHPKHADRLRDLPIWAFHGNRDPVVPVTATTNMISALRAAGGSPRCTIYPHARHNAWSAAYRKTELFDWLLSQHLPKSPRR